MGKKIVYTLAVSLTRPLVDDPTDPDFYTEAGATAIDTQRAIEKEIAHALRKVSGDADVELTEYRVEEE